MDRFKSGAQQYAAYLKTPEGKLRVDLAWENLRTFLPRPKANYSSRALDVGGGTGVMALRLADLGFHATVVETSEAMLATAAEATVASRVAEHVSFQLADAANLSDIFSAASFDVAVCHNLIEYSESPADVLRAIRHVLKREAGAVVSILVRNRAGEVLKAAIKLGDLKLAEQNFTAEWATESLYGEAVRLFSPCQLRGLLNEASLEVIAEHGVRVMADYLPAALTGNDEAYARILALEQKLGESADYAAIARYTQVLARPSTRNTSAPAS